MPVFNAHIPKGRFSSEDKRAFADALNQSLVQGLGIPEGDRFLVLSEHGPDGRWCMNALTGGLLSLVPCYRV